MSLPPKKVGFAVTEKPPFKLTAKFDAAETIKGAAINITVTATRGAAVTEAIALTAQLPPNVTAAVKPIPKDMNEVKIAITPAANAAIGSFPVSFVGKTKVNGKTVYEHDYGYPQHDHLYCERCGKLIEFHSEELKALRDSVAAAHRFRVTSHRLIVVGVCEDCAGPNRRSSLWRTP